jgi:hypothetical protein
MNARSSLRGILSAVIVSTAVLAAANSTRAATITWGIATIITGDSNVSTSGSLVGAFNLGGNGVGNATVNGVTFVGQALSGTNVTFGNFNLSSSSVFNGTAIGGSGNAPFTTLSPGYKTLLTSLVELSNAAITLTMSNLVVGATYQFEWWSNTSDNGLSYITAAAAGPAIILNSNSVASPGGLGEFAIGTFVADATTQQIIFNPFGGPGRVAINAFQLRTTSAASAPDAGSTALLLAGALGSLGFIARRVRR